MGRNISSIHAIATHREPKVYGVFRARGKNRETDERSQVEMSHFRHDRINPITIAIAFNGQVNVSDVRTWLSLRIACEQVVVSRHKRARFVAVYDPRQK